jgi:pimeloyl-ACP methyl ester carboxylesterase
MDARSRTAPIPFNADGATGTLLSGDSAGEGRPIVLLHGLTATRRNVVQGSRHLLSAGWRLISYDARGHGESLAPSDPAAYEYSDLEADLTCVLDQLALESAVLVGSSMGAATAMRFALTSPGRVMALVQITPAYSGSGRVDDADVAHWNSLADALDAGDIAAFVERTGVAELPERWQEPARIATRQRIERHLHLDAVADALRVVSRSEAFAGLDVLESLDLPVLVVGSRDETDPGHPLAIAEEYARRLPRAELVVEEEGASPLAWQGARLSRTIGEFLERVEVAQE